MKKGTKKAKKFTMIRIDTETRDALWQIARKRNWSLCETVRRLVLPE